MLLRIHPLVALVVLWLYIALIQWLTLALPVAVGLPASTAALAIVYLGWPAFIALHLAKYANVVLKRHAMWVAGAYLLNIVLQTGALHVFPGFASTNILVQGFAWLYWALAMASAFYIMWAGSRSLVDAEQGAVAPPNRLIGTFLAFMFLPIGIVFIQMRIRRLLRHDADASASGGQPENTAGQPM